MSWSRSLGVQHGAAARRRVVRDRGGDARRDHGRCPRCAARPSRGSAACARASPTCADARCCCGCWPCRRSPSCSSHSCSRSRSCTRRRRSTRATPATARCSPRGAPAWSSGASCSWPLRGSVSLQAQLVVSTAMIGCAYLGMAAAGTLAVACTAAVIGGIGNGVQWVALMSAVQELTASRYQARVVGLLESLGRVMPGVGFLLGGVIAQLLNPRASFVAAGVGALTVLAVAVPLLRGRRLAARARAGDAAGEAGAVADATRGFRSATRGPSRGYIRSWTEGAACSAVAASRAEQPLPAVRTRAVRPWRDPGRGGAGGSRARLRVPRAAVGLGAGVAAGRAADPLLRELQRRRRGARIRDARRRASSRRWSRSSSWARCPRPASSPCRRSARGSSAAGSCRCSATRPPLSGEPGGSLDARGADRRECRSTRQLGDLPAVAAAGAVLLARRLSGHAPSSSRVAWEGHDLRPWSSRRSPSWRPLRCCC